MKPNSRPTGRATNSPPQADRQQIHPRLQAKAREVLSALVHGVHGTLGSPKAACGVGTGGGVGTAGPGFGLRASGLIQVPKIGRGGHWTVLGSHVGW